MPRTHLVDAGDVTADRLVANAAAHGCDLLGPIYADASWQARAKTGQAQADFALDRAAEWATCPQQTRVSAFAQLAPAT